MTLYDVPKPRGNIIVLTPQMMGDSRSKPLSETS